MKVAKPGLYQFSKIIGTFYVFFQERIRNMTWIKERWWKILETLLDRKVVRQLWSKWSRWWVAIIVILCDHSPQNITKTQQPKSKFHEPYLLSSAFLKRSKNLKKVSLLFWQISWFTKQTSKQEGDFFQILWPSHNTKKTHLFNSHCEL